MTEHQLGTIFGATIGGLCQVAPLRKVRAVITRIAADDGFWSLLENQLLPMTPTMLTSAMIGNKIDQDQ